MRKHSRLTQIERDDLILFLDRGMTQQEAIDLLNQKYHTHHVRETAKYWSKNGKKRATQLTQCPHCGQLLIA